jgi:hypothetical protein
VEAEGGVEAVTDAFAEEEAAGNRVEEDCGAGDVPGGVSGDVRPAAADGMAAGTAASMVTAATGELVT